MFFGLNISLMNKLNMGDVVFSLGTTAALLADQARAFSDVYKLYGFKDDQPLSDYVDFFLHEPVAWFEGLPVSLKSKASFAKPKTALSKALKHDDIIAALGTEACEHAVTVLWNTYKKEADRIVAARSGTSVSQEPTLQVNEVHDVADIADIADIAESDESRPPPKGGQSRKKAKTTVPVEPTVPVVATPSQMSYETKYRVVDRALRAMLSDVTSQNEAMLVFLDALREA